MWEEEPEDHDGEPLVATGYTLDGPVEVVADVLGRFPWDRGEWPCETCFESPAVAFYRPVGPDHAGERARYLCRGCLRAAVARDGT